ncbi:hypothetical protein HG547_11995 [Shewanella sp. DNRA4]|uniref:DUF7660 family protein n=1 Tax=Shewanella sp. DNRA4 TaxID=2723055 RepID=UPI00146A02CC|nr:hypothetical protein [Shewanella sp. DNRA4]NMD52348.1 hypothetical protein [Shewanella sp. DNRA4]
MELHEKINTVGSKEDFADFISALRTDLLAHPDTWENPTLESFLEAMESWVGSMESYYKNTGQECPEIPGWKVFADILYAAKIYE